MLLRCSGWFGKIHARRYAPVYRSMTVGDFTGAFLVQGCHGMLYWDLRYTIKCGAAKRCDGWPQNATTLRSKIALRVCRFMTWRLETSCEAHLPDTAVGRYGPGIQESVGERPLGEFLQIYSLTVWQLPLHHSNKMN